MSNWQPIETGPKDGSRVLLYFPPNGNRSERIEAGYWEIQKWHNRPKPYWSGDCERSLGVTWYRLTQPTHWQPLPEAPNV